MGFVKNEDEDATRLQAGGAGLNWCALCGAEYLAGVQECSDCLVKLVDQPPLGPDDIGDEEGEQTAYEFDDLTAADRFVLDEELRKAGIVHAWEGTTLLVAPYDEDEVDAVLGAADDAEADEIDERLLDPDNEQLVYDMTDWNPNQLAELDGLLQAQGIAHGFDEDGDLVVLATDEERVDAILDQVEFPDQLEVDEDDLDGDGDGISAVDVVGDLFVAADRLTHDATDTEGVLAAVDAATTMATMAVPFGFSPPVWTDLNEQAARLRRLLETEAEVVDDEAVVAAATALRTALRQYV